MTRWRIDGFRAESALAQRCRLLLNPIRIVVNASPAATKISAKSAAEVDLSLIYILALLAQKLAKKKGRPTRATMHNQEQCRGT